VMPVFRLLYFGGRSGGISGSEEFHAPSDEEAVLFARGRQNGHPVELWHEGRKIKRWEVSHQTENKSVNRRGRSSVHQASDQPR
jgi:hypothetical protein